MTIESTITLTWDGKLASFSEFVPFSITFDEEALLIHIDAPFHEDTPPSAPQGSTDELWNYEVIEFFIAEDIEDSEKARYTEIECSPHGHYLVLQLEGERNIVNSGLSLEYVAMIKANNTWQGMLKVPFSMLPPAPYKFNAYAIHGEGDERRYLTLFPLSGSKPDFHQLSAFRKLEDKKAKGMKLL